jgi:hypothetical protein
VRSLTAIPAETCHVWWIAGPGCSCWLAAIDLGTKPRTEPVPLGVSRRLGSKTCLAGSTGTRRDARNRLAARRPHARAASGDSVVLQLFFSCRSRRTTVRQVLPAPSSPGIPPEDRRAAGRSSRCPAVHLCACHDGRRPPARGHPASDMNRHGHLSILHV